VNSHHDPFTLEIIQNGLVAVADEMFDAVQRTSMSPIIYETLDFSVGITDVAGNLLTQGNGVTAFLGVLDAHVRDVLTKFGDDIHEGDVFISNDVYAGGGTHLSDPALISPVFFKNELVAFVANKAHWTELGGKDPGSVSTNATEVFQEGLQLPNVRVISRGKAVQAVLDIIEANVRLPKNSLGDMWSGVAANRVGAQRIQKIFSKYGFDAVHEASRQLLEYGERMVKAELASLPQGQFEAQDYIDADGLGNGPFHVQVRVTISKERFIADFTGSHPQVLGPVNCSRTGLISAVRTIFKALTNPQISANAGVFRPIEVVCPTGTIFTAVRPAPVSLYWETLIMGTDLIWKALAPHVPHRLGAGHMVSVCGTTIWGRHPDTGVQTLFVQPLVGGWGAESDRDGQNGQFSSADGETYNLPVEIIEKRYGIRVEEYAFHDDEGGAGEFRGGKGCSLKFRLMSDKALLTASFGRSDHPAWGVGGGHRGSPNYFEVHRTDGSVERHSIVNRLPLFKGDLLHLVTATGGGWGDPKEREQAAIENDLKNGFVTRELVEKHYC
jgi:N-methylhydantoinase B